MRRRNLINEDLTPDVLDSTNPMNSINPMNPLKVEEVMSNVKG